VLIYLENRRAEFLPHEADFVTTNLSGVSRRVQRQVLELGSWERLPAGAVLTREGEPVADLVYLAEGEAGVTLNGERLATRHAGSLIGELTVATGAPAKGTVVTESEAFVWCAPANAVRKAIATQPEQAAALQAAFFRAVSGKLTEPLSARP
jgi:CRP-like cAMP-binding protein